MNKILKNALCAGAVVCLGTSLVAPVFGGVSVKAEEPSEYVLTQQSATYSEDLWANATAYDMTTVEDPAVEGATGSVKYLLVGTDLYMRISAHDATKNTGDTPVFKVTAGGKTSELLTGRYLEPVDKTEDRYLSWPRKGTWNFTEVEMTGINVTYANETYTYTCGFQLGDVVTDGAKITLMAGHGDAFGSANWSDGLTSYAHALKFEQEFTISVPSAPVEDPNDWAVPKLTGDYSEDIWASAKNFDLTATKGTSEGANVKVALLGTAFYFRLTATDSTKESNDTPTFLLKVGNTEFKLDRGSYLDTGENSVEPIRWIRLSPANSYVKMTTEYKDGAYVFTAGFDLGDKNTVDGSRINFTIRHCDIDSSADWADNDGIYKNISAFDHVLYAGQYTEEDPTPKPVEYPTDPEPTAGPENVDQKIVIQDVAKMPLANEASWKDIPKYNMLARNGNSEGATGTVQVVTCDGNFLFRVEIHDDTISYNRDGRYIEFGNGLTGDDGKNFVAQGNYDTSEGLTGWLNISSKPFAPEPSLGLCELTFTEGNDKTGDSVTEENPYGNTSKGVYVYYLGYQMRDYNYDMSEGQTVHLKITHADSRHKGEAWASDNRFHTIYFDQVLTFGEPADTTIRPETATDGFTAQKGTVSFNKAEVTWNDFDDAEQYRLRLYKVNGADAAEPYEFVTEEIVYGGESSYKFEFTNLSAETQYAVQVQSLDNDDQVVASSSLATFTTLKQGETPVDPGTDPENPDKPNPDKPGDNKKNGCGSSVAFASVFVTVSALAAAATAIVIAAKKKQK